MKTLYNIIIKIVKLFCLLFKPILKTNTATIIANKLFTLGCKLLKPIFKDDGTVTPGYYATMYNKEILDELIYADEIIVLDDSRVYKYTKLELFKDLSILSEHGLQIPFTLKVIECLSKKGIHTYHEADILTELEKL